MAVLEGLRWWRLFNRSAWTPVPLWVLRVSVLAPLLPILYASEYGMLALVRLLTGYYAAETRQPGRTSLYFPAAQPLPGPFRCMESIRLVRFHYGCSQLRINAQKKAVLLARQSLGSSLQLDCNTRNVLIHIFGFAMVSSWSTYAGSPGTCKFNWWQTGSRITWGLCCNEFPSQPSLVWYRCIYIYT